MDEALAARWNEVVGEEDVVWHLGISRSASAPNARPRS
jgi:calcineurin-like phosphoesterase family protein